MIRLRVHFFLCKLPKTNPFTLWRLIFSLFRLSKSFLLIFLTNKKTLFLYYNKKNICLILLIPGKLENHFNHFWRSNFHCNKAKKIVKNFITFYISIISNNLLLFICFFVKFGFFVIQMLKSLRGFDFEKGIKCLWFCYFAFRRDWMITAKRSWAVDDRSLLNLFKNPYKNSLNFLIFAQKRLYLLWYFH